MADSKTSALPPAVSPLDGTELFPVVQGGVSKKATLAAALALLVGSSPEALNTLDKLAAALGDDANFAATVTTALAGKEPSIAPGTYVGTNAPATRTRGLTQIPGPAEVAISIQPVTPGGTYSKDFPGPERVVEFRYGTSPGITAPYDLGSYFSASGSYATGTSVLVSNKRMDINGAIQGVSALLNGGEPSMVAVSTDINGPALALESGIASNPNCTAIAIYSLDAIAGGATPYSQGYGTKKWAIDDVGKMYWGANLGTTPAASSWVTLAKDPNSPGTMRMTAPAGAAVLELDGNTGAVLKLLTAGVTKLYIGTGSATQSIIMQSGQLAARVNSDGGWVFGDGDGSGAAMILRHSNAGFPRLWVFQAVSQTADMVQLTTFSGASVLSRFDKGGYLGLRQITAPADAAVATSEVMPWWKNTVGAAGLQVKGKDSAGTVVVHDFSKGSAVTAPAGGATIDAESRTAIGQIIGHLQRMGVAA